MMKIVDKPPSSASKSVTLMPIRLMMFAGSIFVTPN